MKAVLCIAVFLLVVAGPLVSHAQSLPSSCDPDFYSLMKVRSELEGMRELETAQTLILKPDSVLEYSCFSARVNAAGGPVSGLFNNNVGPHFSALAAAPAGAFVNANFSHAMGGGSVTGAATCNSMKAVWDAIKCKNADIVNFRTFQDLAGTDPRNWPLGACVAPTRSSTYTTGIAVFNPAPALPPASGGVEAVTTHLDLLDPAACSGLSPIPTGIMASGSSGVYEEMVCPAPGCYHDGSGSCVP